MRVPIGAMAGGVVALAMLAGCAAAGVDPELKKVLPQSFLQLGMQTHRGFDQLADRIEAGAMTQDALKSLVSLTGNCVVCHATYRLDEAR